MKSFKRVFPYVLAQWPRLVLIVIVALINSVLFSASIAAIIPLLKVMMGQEGLHGWVDRTIATERYGLAFYIPDKEDIASDPNMNHFLRVVSVRKNGASAKTGLRPNDMIIAVSDTNATTTSNAMLARLASADSNQPVTILRPPGQKLVMELGTPHLPFYAPYLSRAICGLKYLPCTR